MSSPSPKKLAAGPPIGSPSRLSPRPARSSNHTLVIWDNGFYFSTKLDASKIVPKDRLKGQGSVAKIQQVTVVKPGGVIARDGTPSPTKLTPVKHGASPNNVRDNKRGGESVTPKSPSKKQQTRLQTPTSTPTRSFRARPLPSPASKLPKKAPSTTAPSPTAHSPPPIQPALRSSPRRPNPPPPPKPPIQNPPHIPRPSTPSQTDPSKPLPQTPTRRCPSNIDERMASLERPTLSPSTARSRAASPPKRIPDATKAGLREKVRARPPPAFERSRIPLKGRKGGDGGEGTRGD